MKRLIGYHGTTKKSSIEIIKSQKMTPSKGYDEWLSRGIYFFLRKDDAVWWCSCRNYIDNAIIVADIEYCEDDVLNLVDNKYDIVAFSKFCDLVKNKSPKLPNGLPRRNYMQLAIEKMRDHYRKMYGKDFSMAIAMFNENRPGKIKEYNKFPIIYGQIQICVYNANIIKKLWLDTEGEC